MADTTAGATASRPTFSDGYKRVVLSLLLLAYTLNFIDRTILATVGIKIREDLGLSSAQMGILGGLYFALTYTILGIPVARLAERMSRVRIITAALVIWSGFTALCGTAGNFATLALYRFGVGVGEAGCSPPSHSLISDYFEPKKRASALAIYSFGIPLGTMFGAAVGGYLAETFGWRTAFYVVGLPGILLALIVWLVIKEPPRGHADLKEDAPALAEAATAEAVKPKAGFLNEMKEIGATAKALFLQWPVANMALGVTIASFGSYGSGAFVPQYFYTTFPLTLAITGLLVGLVGGFSSGLGTLTGGFLTDWLSKRSPVWYSLTPALGLLIALPIYLLAYNQTDWKITLLILLVPGIFHYTYLAPTFAVAQNAVPVQRRATATALLFFVLNFIALGGGPTFSGSLVDQYAAYGFTHTDALSVWPILGGALAHAAGETLMSYVHIVTGLVDMATGAHPNLLPPPTTGFAHACPGGKAPAAAGAAAAMACKKAISWGSQQSVLISLCFYAWASLHYFLGCIGLTKALRKNVAV